ncbi:hypothetical protein QEN19_004039 [Hanseniaspora menglaensis]
MDKKEYFENFHEFSQKPSNAFISSQNIGKQSSQQLVHRSGQYTSRVPSKQNFVSNQNFYALYKPSLIYPPPQHIFKQPNIINSNQLLEPYQHIPYQNPTQTPSQILLPPLNHEVHQKKYRPTRYIHPVVPNVLKQFDNAEIAIQTKTKKIKPIDHNQRSKRRACESCRIKKRRCDLTAPCSNCLKSDIHCYYNQIEKDILVELFELKEQNEGLKAIILQLQQQLNEKKF